LLNGVVAVNNVIDDVQEEVLPMDDADVVPVVEEMIHEVAAGEPVVAVVAEKEEPVIPLADVDGNVDVGAVAAGEPVVAAVAEKEEPVIPLADVDGHADVASDDLAVAAV
ncbi:hypothetical protein Tco_0280830, partial [Tanacetum coccineum]